MEKALKIQKGKEELVSASDIQLEFHGKTPWGISFICPLCRQPLFPAAMSSGGVQSPHFRHERNNKRAHECELYASRYGYFSTYQRVPMPMFIKRSLSHNGQFIVEGGFRRLDPLVFSELEREGAKVVIGQKSYTVSSQRFGCGLTKLPFEEISLNCGSTVELIGSSYDLNSTWGYPEDARRAMVFKRDADTGQGRRLKIGDTIPFETDLFLLLRDKERDRVCAAFAGARKAGVAGGRSASTSLAVYEARLSKDDSKWRHGKAYLEECGFEVDDIGDTPKLIWPPALTASGDLLPMYENAKCIFEADMGSATDGNLYVHTNTDTAERVRTVPLRKTDNESCGFAVFKNNARLSFITTRDWVFSSTVLLHPSDLNVDEWLHACDLEPRLSLGEGRWTLEVSAPAEIVCHERNGVISTIKLSGVNRAFCFEDGMFDRICVQQKLSASIDQLVIFEKLFERWQVTGTISEEVDAKAALIELDMPNDQEFAIVRGKGKRKSHQGVDKRRTLIRKAGR